MSHSKDIIDVNLKLVQYPRLCGRTWFLWTDIAYRCVPPKGAEILAAGNIKTKSFYGMSHLNMSSRRVIG